MPDTFEAGPDPERAAEAFDRHLANIARMFGEPDQATPSKASRELSDIERLQRLMEIDRRHLWASARTLPGKVGPAVLAELGEVLVAYEELIDAGAPAYPYYDIDDVRGKAVDVLYSLAQACENLHDTEQAKDYYVRAEEAYRRLGLTDKVQRCKDALAALRFGADADVDAELIRLHNELDANPEPSLHRVELLLELAELHLGVRDDYEAEQFFDEAERLLADELGHASPSGSALAETLFGWLQRGFAGEETPGAGALEELMKVRSLYERLYRGKSKLLIDHDPQAAAEYSARLTDMSGSIDEGSRLNAEFSDRAAELLGPFMSRFADRPGDRGTSEDA